MATQDISQYLNALERQDRYRVDKVLKSSGFETTQLVYLPETNGAESGPYIRKIITRGSGFGNAYERIYAEQRHNTFAHIPHIVDCVHSDDVLMVVMEYIHGETLQDFIYRADPSTDVAAAIFPEICSAVQELHEAFDPPIIHRDLKPSNVMVANGAVFLIDFGIARDYNDQASTDTTHFGTRTYAPPEQFGYGQTSTKSDIYALGMLLYYCLAEKTPTSEVVNAHFSDLGILPEMQNVLVRATEFDPNNRFTSVRELKEAFLGAVQAGKQRSVAPANTPSTTSTRDIRVAPTSALTSASASTVIPTPTSIPVPASIQNSTPAPAAIGEAPYDMANNRGASFYLGILWNIFVGLFCIGGCIYYIRQILAGAGDASFGTYSLSSIFLLGIGLLISDKRLLREKFPDTIGKVKNWHIFIALVLLVLFATIIFVFAAMFTGR